MPGAPTHPPTSQGTPQMLNRKLVGAAAMTAVLGLGGVAGMALGNPLSSGAQDGGTTTTTTPTDHDDGGRGGHRGLGGDHLETAADALGMTTQELRTALADGKSLAEVAADQGVDKQKLIDALVAAAEKRLDEAKATLPERIAALVDGTLPEGGPGHGGPGGGHGGPGRRFRIDERLEAAATALAMSEADLRAALEDGTKSLADIAEEKGVDKQKVIDAMVADAKASLAEAVKAGKLTQAHADERAANLADRMAEAVERTRPEDHGPHDLDGPDEDADAGGN
ncbi:MAG: LysM peptidoglycan-binding protein [Acidimicrobiales bacterium]|nr:LysM peptidoglycan-binding protein [Acidimicrobiales bacterium]